MKNDIKNSRNSHRNGQNNLRITIFISCLSGGGAERVGCNLANYLHSKGYLVDVITIFNKNDIYVLKDGVRRINLLEEDERVSRIRDICVRFKRLKQYVIANPDVSCYVVMLPINSFMIAALKKHIRGKVVISERNNPSSYGLGEKFMMKYAAKKSDGLVVQTEEIGKWYNGIDEKITIPNAMNNDAIFPRSKSIENKIVTVGRLCEQKNYPMVIQAFSIFIKKHPNYKLEIYGQGELETYVRELISKYGLDDKVVLMGQVKNVSECISNAKCFVMSSNYEGMSNALIEAMCIGLPCVVTDCDGGGAKELVEDGINGILIEKGAIKDLAGGMCKIVEDSQFRKKISNNAEKLQKRLDPNRIYNKWMEYINKIIKGKEAITKDETFCEKQERD